MVLALISIFIIGYTCIALEHPLKVNKTATALLLGTALWAVFSFCNIIFRPDLDIEQWRSFISGNLVENLGETAEIVFFLLGAMTIVTLVEDYQGFRIITDKITTTNKKKLLWELSILTFFLSALLDNMTTAIVMCALLSKLIADKKERWLFAGMVILAANAGGAWSPIGDVTTIMLWVAGKVSTGAVMTHALIPSLVSMIIPLIIVSFVERGEIDASQRPKEDKSLQVPAWQRNLIFFMGVAALVFVPVFKILTHLKPYMGIMLGLSILWITTEILHKTSQDENRRYTISGVLTRIDLPTILFFLGILLAVAGLQSAGHLSMLAVGMDSLFHGNYYLVDTVIGMLSSIVDNVPLVAGVMGMYEFPIDHTLWVYLSYCAGTGGSLLIIGSAAGVAVMGMEKIDFVWYLKKITPYALLGYLAGAGVYVLMDKFIFAADAVEQLSQATAVMPF